MTFDKGLNINIGHDGSLRLMVTDFSKLGYHLLQVLSASFAICKVLGRVNAKHELCASYCERPLHSRTPDLRRPRTGDPVELGVLPQLDTLSEAFLGICHRFAFFDEPRRHEEPRQQHLCAFVPLWWNGFVADLWGSERVRLRVNAGSCLQRSRGDESVA